LPRREVPAEDQLYKLVLNENNLQALDDLTIGGWGCGLGAVLADSVKDLRQRYIDHQRTRLSDGRVRVLNATRGQF
jgi:hypothetical protein